MKIIGIAKRIILQFVRDKRSLAMIFVFPVILLWFFSLFLTNGNVDVKIGLVGATPIETALSKEEHVTVTSYSLDDAKEAIKSKEINGYLVTNKQEMTLVVDDSDSSHRQALLGVLQKVTKPQQGPTVKIENLYGTSDLSLFDTIGPVFIGLFSFMFVFILSGVAFVRERLTGTLERIFVSPIKKSEIVFGYIFGFGVFALIQAVIITFAAVKILNMYVAGSVLDVLLINISISITALTLGTFLSSFAANEFQMVQMIPAIVVPQIIFTGIFPIDSLPTFLVYFSKLFPLTYGAEALRDVMIRGEGLGDVVGLVGALALFSFVFIIGNMLSLRRYRK